MWDAINDDKNESVWWCTSLNTLLAVCLLKCPLMLNTLCALDKAVREKHQRFSRVTFEVKGNECLWLTKCQWELSGVFRRNSRSKTVGNFQRSLAWQHHSERGFTRSWKSLQNLKCTSRNRPRYLQWNKIVLRSSVSVSANQRFLGSYWVTFIWCKTNPRVHRVYCEDQHTTLLR